MVGAINFLISTPIQTHSKVPDGFTFSLSHRVYQEDGWINATLKKGDLRHRKEREAIYNAFQGRRHDTGLLLKYRTLATDKLTEGRILDAVHALFAFSGAPWGERFSYASSRTEPEFGTLEYWHLATHWPPNPSPVQYRARTSLYSLIGGNIKLRLKAYEHYLKTFPEDDDMRRISINIRLQMHPHWKKLSKEEFVALSTVADTLYKRNKGLNFLLCRYTTLVNAMEQTKDRKMADEVLKLGKVYAARCRFDKYDALDIDGVNKFLARLKDRIAKGEFR